MSMFDTPEFQALRREYLQGAMARGQHLKEAVADLRAGREVDLTHLRQEVHKFRGSGGFYGFKDLSAAAAEAEDHLILVLDGDRPRDDQAIADLVEKVTAKLDAAVRQVGLS